jgi:hypothetical protein
MTEKKSNFNMFLLLWSGELIASIGSGLTAFGLGIYVFQQTGLASSVSLITLLAENLGTIFGIGSGRGTGLLIFVSGIFLSLTALLLLVSKSLRKLES